MKVIVDFDSCLGNANCMMAAPEVFQVRNDGSLVVLNETPSPELRAKVEAAARICPTQAIRIEG
jgi:ferredoxin